MNVQAMTLVPLVELIDQEEIAVLNDIRHRCFYSTWQDKQKFEAVVSRAVGCSKFSEIPSASFESAYNVAITTLRNRGEKILRGKN